MSIKTAKYVKIESQDTPVIKFVDTEDKKYGVALNDILGDVGLDGVYRLASSNKPFVINFDGIVEFDPVKSWGKFAYMFEYNDCVMGVDFASIRKINTGRIFTETFYGCQGLEFARFPNLVEVGLSSGGGYALDNCFRESSLEELEMPALEYVKGEYSMRSFLYGCKKLKRVSLPALKEITGNYSFYYFLAETEITEMKFESLTYVGSYSLSNMFYLCPNLREVWFYAFEDCASQYSFNGMLNGCSGVTVHFPMRMESTMRDWYLVSIGFNGTDTTVLFDLVTSIVGANGVTYYRKEKDSVDGAIAWTRDGDLFYTQGNSEPEIGSPIFSEKNCINVVTVVTERG